MVPTGLLLTVRTTFYHYIVRRDHISEIRMITSLADVAHCDERGKPVVRCELGHLLDPTDLLISTRKQALIVPTRRRSVALLVDRVEDFSDASLEVIQPLSSILAPRLARSWFIGTLIRNDTPFLILDVRQIAQDVLFGQHNTATTNFCQGA